jgi:hypothetical protein
MSNVNHGSWGQLVLSSQRGEGMWTMQSYMKLAEKEERGIFSLASGRN